MLVLATIYGVMNILSFVALIYIGAGEFTICAQLKILSTAMFSVLVLGTSLSIAKWRALGLLVIGITQFNSLTHSLTHYYSLTHLLTHSQVVYSLHHPLWY